MPQSPFFVFAAQAEAGVADLRERFDASTRLGVPTHLTVAHCQAAEAEVAAAELASRLERSGLNDGVCNAVNLLQNSSGRWQVMQTFELPRDSAPGYAAAG